MNRREFLRNSCRLGGALLLGTGLLDAFTSSASCHAAKDLLNETKPFSLPEYIMENHFQFGYLQPRAATRQLVVHHTGIGGNNNLNAQAIHRMHLRNGWSGIGYHFFIRKDGSVETGRPLDQVGAHAYGYNKTTIGICLAGNFDIETPTNGQIATAAELLALLCRRYNLQPGRRSIVGHRDLDPTDCPGNLFYPHLYELREQTALRYDRKETNKPASIKKADLSPARQKNLDFDSTLSDTVQLQTQETEARS